MYSDGSRPPFEDPSAPLSATGEVAWLAARGARKLCFGDFEIDCEAGELRRAGTPIKLQQQPFKMLSYLAARAGEVVSREALRAFLWGSHTHVDFDQGLNFCTRRIRDALGEDAHAPRFLETLPRRGYRFVASVTRIERNQRADAPRAEDRSVAVLPFADLSRGRDQGYFCDGLAEEIRGTLKKVSGLRVAARVSCVPNGADGAGARVLGERLGVATLLDGSVRKVGELLRVSVELIDCRDGFQLWCERYERELKDVFAVQDEIAQAVAAALEVRLTAQERDALQTPATRDVRAFDLYLRAHSFFDQFHRRSIAIARELFSRAIEVDPGYARAYAGLCDCHAYAYTHLGRDAAELEAAFAAGRQALALAPGLAEAHASLGMVLCLDGRPDEAEAEFETAIRLDPRLFEAHYYYARALFAQGRLEQAREHYEEASLLRRDDYQSPLLVSQIYEDLGRADEAAAARRRGLAIVEERLRAHPDDLRALYMGANALVALGERERGLQWAAQAVRIEPGEPMLLYNVACIQCLAGQPEAALASLERAMTLGPPQREWLEHDSNLDALRADPRFQALLRGAA